MGKTIIVAPAIIVMVAAIGRDQSLDEFLQVLNQSRFMIAPLPNWRSIWLTARSIAFSRFTSISCLLQLAYYSFAEGNYFEPTVNRAFGL